MIDKKFWMRVAEKWSQKDDGGPPVPPPDIIPIEINDDPITNDEIDGILADLGLDF